MGTNGSDTKRRRITVLTPDEVEQAERLNEWLGPLVRFAAYTGLRPGELYGLTWDAVGDRLVTVSQAVRQKQGNTLGAPKTDSAFREVVLLPQAREALTRLDERAPYVFPAPDGRSRLTQRVVAYYWPQVRDELLERVGEARARMIDNVRFYDLRHFYGTHLAVRLKLPPVVIAQQMGHSDQGETAMRRYIRASAEDCQRQVLEAMTA